MRESSDGGGEHSIMKPISLSSAAEPGTVEPAKTEEYSIEGMVEDGLEEMLEFYRLKSKKRRRLLLDEEEEEEEEKEEEFQDSKHQKLDSNSDSVKYMSKYETGELVEVDLKELVHYLNEIKKSSDLDVNIEMIAEKVYESLVEGKANAIKESKLSEFLAIVSSHFATIHNDYQKFGARIAIDWLNRSTPQTFSECVKVLYENVRECNSISVSNPLISTKIYNMLFVDEGHESVRQKIDNVVDVANKRGFQTTYFGFTTLEKSYLIRLQVPQHTTNLKNGESAEKTFILGPIQERIEYMFMRVALGIHGKDIDAAIETFEGFVDRKFTHASPTLFSSGTNKPQLSSCFLMQAKDDSIVGIYDSLKDCALISQAAGGIAISVSNIRARGSPIHGTNGFSSGIIPMLKIYNHTAAYVDQGGGKRKGSIAVYIEPWHSDFEQFINLRNSKGDMSNKCRDLNLGIWYPSLFFDLVNEDGDWYMFCPHECPGLDESYGEEFEKLYYYYVRKGLARKKVKARDLYNSIIMAQVEDGQPYTLYKDNANEKSNHKHLGTLKCSNLCTEILEYVSPDEVAVCNLASLCLASFLKETIDESSSTPNPKNKKKNYRYDFKELQRCVRILVRNLNKIIDINMYPIKETLKSNLRHRPMGIGVQGLADVYAALRISFDSPEAMKLNEDIFACIYYTAVQESIELAKRDGYYESFPGSPASQGILQPDMWASKHKNIKIVQSVVNHDGEVIQLDWESRKKDVMEHGMRNSLLIAPMPTASTSQIMGGSETTQPYVSCMYSRVTLTGRHQIVNQALIDELTEIGMWDEVMRQRIISEKGSIASIEIIPADIRERHRTIYELHPEALVRMAAARGPYIDQSQSLNLFVDDPIMISKLTFLAHDLGLKGIYYWRVSPKLKRVMTALDKQIVEKSMSMDSAAYAAPYSTVPQSTVSNTSNGPIMMQDTDYDEEALIKKKRGECVGSCSL